MTESSATKDFMGRLHNKVAESLLSRIEASDATAADYANAIKFLKDNGIEARADVPGALNSLAEKMKLPEFNDEEDSQVH